MTISQWRSVIPTTYYLLLITYYLLLIIYINVYGKRDSNPQNPEPKSGVSTISTIPAFFYE